MDPRLQVLLEYFILRFAVQHVCLYYYIYIFPKYFILSARCDENQDYIINMVCMILIYAYAYLYIYIKGEGHIYIYIILVYIYIYYDI